VLPKVYSDQSLNHSHEYDLSGTLIAPIDILKGFCVINIAIAVFLGGGLGSVARWLLSLRLNLVHHAIPVGTLAANLIGAFIIGAGLAWFTRMSHLDPMWKLLITTGFCGGLTTFSTFSAEVVFLLQDGRFGWAALNVTVNLLGSLLMTGLAFWLFSHLSSR